ncbi:NfeD family protein [Sutterella sp.]|uniref:NfeD family protein n=1 Tax=Sutterella sp. TaxID=1981025 RepID=UPI0026DF86A0|nr:hypothetical protein [Sutterella sp.]MDO5531148.1 hypothetical protein [Sutterella sp.]
MISISPALAWIIAAAAVLAVELFLNTIYLIAVAVAFAVTALAAWLGMSFSWQLFICAVLVAAGGIAVMQWRRRTASRKDESERLQNLDRGQCVVVNAVGTDGLAVVEYRGSTWIARPGGADPLSPGRWTIERVDGAQLVLGEKLP